MTQSSQLTEEVVQKVLNWLDSTEGFVVEQAPLLAQEVLAFGWTMAWVCGIAGVLIIGAGVGIVVWGRKPIAAITDDEFFVWLIGIVVLLCGIALSCFSIFDLVQITLAPRLYLLEELSKLL